MVYQIIASVLLFIFYFSYFFKFFSLKNKGVKVNNLGTKYNKTKEVIKSEIVLKIFTFLMFIVEIISIIISDNWYYINVPPFIKIIGLCFIMLGDISFILSLYYMKTSWRVGIDELSNDSLITNGIYKFSRNPAFLGFDLTYIGMCFVFSNPVIILFAIILIWMFDNQIIMEEEYLERKYKEQYVEYKKHTKRYFIIF